MRLHRTNESVSLTKKSCQPPNVKQNIEGWSDLQGHAFRFEEGVHCQRDSCVDVSYMDSHGCTAPGPPTTPGTAGLTAPGAHAWLLGVILGVVV